MSAAGLQGEQPQDTAATPGHRCSSCSIPAGCAARGHCWQGWAPRLCSVPCAASSSWTCPGRCAGAAGRSLNRQQEPEQAAAPRERSGRLRLHPGWRQPLLHLQIFTEPAQPVVGTGGLPQGCWVCAGNTEALAGQILVAFQ